MIYRMKLVLLFSVLLLACLSSAIGQSKQASLELTLDRVTLYRPCPHFLPAKYRTCPNGMTINVDAVINGKIGKKPNYEYSVSGGTIVGSGSKVVWDMSKAMPGTYVVTTTARGGSTKTKLSTTRTITVQECGDCFAECLDCPDLDIHASRETISPGETVEFWLAQLGGEFKYRWAVEGGEIIAGQGTDHITVKVDPKLTKNQISMTVKIVDGGFCFEVGGCPDHAEMELQLTDPKPK